MNSISIMWETNVSVNCTVSWGNSPFTMSQSVNSTSIIGNGSSRIHVASITGLSPDTRYYYRVTTANGIQSNIYHFYTLPTKASNASAAFVAMSDIQRDGGNPDVYFNLVRSGIIAVTDTALVRGRYGINGLLIPGDLVQDGGNYPTWRNDFFNLADTLTPYVPLYPALGNHEYYNGGLSNYLKYFALPLNGTSTHPEQWWYKDFSNTRVIALNSNDNTTNAPQLSWIDGVLADAASDPDIDFVFAQLHHPFKSELWTPGENAFTGNIIAKMEAFTQSTGKPSIHFFGHTHGYSRGASRDHEHLWIDVAVAGGAIDNWGEFPNADYDEFVLSEDEYGFVLIETTAGNNPKVRIRRFSRGDQTTTENNTLSDQITIKRYGYGPQKPVGIYPSVDSIGNACVRLEASAYHHPGYTHQASHWQLSEDCTFATGVIHKWKQSTNWYNEVNTQANDDLTDEIILGLQPFKTYCWRVRYRDQDMKWSPWSDPKTFHTKSSYTSGNLLLNPDAESGISSWTGNIESLTNNECGSVPVYQGLRFFGVGGICANEMTNGLATQMVNVTSYQTLIDQGLASAALRGYLRTWANNNDKPEMYLECVNASGSILATSSILSNTTPVWLPQYLSMSIPVGTRGIRVVLKGTRLAGTDNDSYFDALSLEVGQVMCPTCIGSPLISAVDSDSDGYCDNIDCAPGNAAIHPAASEQCDGVDNNCDGQTDSGQVVTWTGGAGNNQWELGSNWSQGFVPLPCQRAILPTGAAVLLSQYAPIHSLKVNTGATLTIAHSGELLVTGQNNNIAAEINGSCNLNGRLLIHNTQGDNLIITGNLTTGSASHALIKPSTLKSVHITTTGALINNGEIEVK
jgi:acid phosphatase type 7